MADSKLYGLCMKQIVEYASYSNNPNKGSWDDKRKEINTYNLSGKSMDKLCMINGAAHSKENEKYCQILEANGPLYGLQNTSNGGNRNNMQEGSFIVSPAVEYMINSNKKAKNEFWRWSGHLPQPCNWIII